MSRKEKAALGRLRTTGLVRDRTQEGDLQASHSHRGRVLGFASPVTAALVFLGPQVEGHVRPLGTDVSMVQSWLYHMSIVCHLSQGTRCPLPARLSQFSFFIWDAGWAAILGPCGQCW